MPRRKPQAAQDSGDYVPPAPLWRFGPAGWAMLPIAAALGIVAITGYDLRARLLELIYATLGIDAVMFSISPLHANASALCSLWPYPVVSVFTVWCMLLGAAIHPSRFATRRACLLLTLALMPQSLWMNVTAWMFRLSGQLPFEMNVWTHLAYQIPIDLLLSAVVAIPVYILYRARAVALTMMCMTLFATIIMVDYTSYIYTMRSLLPPGFSSALSILVGWGFNIPILAVSLWWGISARRRHAPPWACTSCRYDLRGVTDPVCPECGAAHKHAPATNPATP